MPQKSPSEPAKVYSLFDGWVGLDAGELRLVYGQQLDVTDQRVREAVKKLGRDWFTTEDPNV